MAEKIKCAAVEWLNGDKCEVLSAMHHCDCFAFGAEKYGETFRNRDKNQDRQGYLTTRDRFVDRAEAFQIADQQGQLIAKSPNQTLLDSYNVNFALEDTDDE